MTNTTTDTAPVYCEHCDRKLNPAKIAWLELNNVTNRYHPEGVVPEDDSQGMFPFGTTCARKVLQNGGTW